MIEKTRALFENRSVTLNQRMSKKSVCFSMVDKMSALLLGGSTFEKLMFVHHNHTHVTVFISVWAHPGYQWGTTRAQGD
jgi:hypothetical protein